LGKKLLGKYEYLYVKDMSKIIRVGVTFPPDLLKDFDEIINKMGYESRSKAIQDAVRLYVSERKWLKEEVMNQTGVILMVYEHDVRGLESELTESQHHHASLISSTMHIHLGEHDCLEVIAVKGKASEIRHLSDELTTRRGVKILRTMIVSL
jgi:CopG family transcriptional regulator, nickel-responsive regulator